MSRSKYTDTQLKRMADSLSLDEKAKLLTYLPRLKDRKGAYRPKKPRNRK